MSGLVSPMHQAAWPRPSALLELLKPLTWFAPVWAFGCGVVSAGGTAPNRWGMLAAGLLLAGPLACGTSQAVNDWFDRHVDAINEPDRPIPSGRVPGRWGLGLACIWSALSAGLALSLGAWVGAAGLFGLVLAWAYSAPPIRLKRNGWWSNAAVGLSYEGLPWFAGAALCLGTLPPVTVLLLAGLYSLGAHGIMTLNDFKSIEGDRQMRLGSLPVRLGPDRACRLACWTMAVPQVVVIGLLLHWQHPAYAAVVGALLLIQFVLMRRLLREPRRLAPWYNATGTSLYVLGMLAAAIAVAP